MVEQAQNLQSRFLFIVRRLGPDAECGEMFASRPLRDL
jgi:hypothetical protein